MLKRHNLVPIRFFAGKKRALVLGGGFVRGMAHIGVLKVLEEHRLGFDLITGNSMGGLIAAAYASGLYDADNLAAKLHAVIVSPEFRRLGLMIADPSEGEDGRSLSHFFITAWDRVRFYRRLLSRPFIADNTRLRVVLEKIFDHRRLEDFPLPCALVATDIRRREKVVFDRGDVIDAVAATVSIPGIFQPQIYQGMELVDGGCLDNIPVDEAVRRGAQSIVAVNVDNGHFPEFRKKTGLERYLYGGEIVAQTLSRKLCEAADAVLYPVKGYVDPLDFSAFETMIQAGKQAARDQLPVLKRCFRKRLF